MSLSKEEIEKSLDEVTVEQEKVNLLNSYAYKMLREDLSYAVELTERALSISERVNYKRGVAEAYTNMGSYCFYGGNSKEECKKSFEKAEQLFEELPEEERESMGRALSGLGSYYMERADYLTASGYFRRALNVSEHFGNTRQQGIVYNNLSFIHESLKQFDRSLEYSRKAAILLEKSSDYVNYVIILNNLGDVCYKMGYLEESMEHLKRAESVVNERGIEFLRGMLLLTMGEIYLKMGNLKAAEERLLQAEGLSKKSDENTLESKTFLQLGELYTCKKERKMALYYLKRALTAAKENSVINVMPEINSLIYQNYKELGNYKEALSYFESYYEQREREFSLEMEESIRNVESESLKKSNERIKIISEIGREITATLDIKRLLELIFQRVNSLIEASGLGIASYDDESRQMEYNIFLNGKGLLPSFQISVDDDSLAAFTIKERCDIMINDFYNEYSRYLKNEPSPHLGPEEEDSLSLIFVPLLIEERVIGAVSAQSNRKGAYNQNDLDSLKALAAYIAIALNNSRQAEQIREKNKELKRLAITDYLTGIYNRREFEKQLNSYWSISTGKNDCFSILLIDADHFKDINDTYGHPAGDECLKELALLFQSKISGVNECLARYGGEEFIILLNCPASEAINRAEDIRSEVEGYVMHYKNRSITITVSVGVSSVQTSFIGGRRGPEQLISRADEALYRSKVEGRNRVTFLDF